MVYGLVRCTLDDFSRLDTRWVPDLSTLVLFIDEGDRDRSMDELNDACDAYELWVAVSAPVISHRGYASAWRILADGQPRGGNGQFIKKQDNESQ